MSENKSIPPGWPFCKPIYDVEKTYLENAEQGPFFTGEYVARQWPSRDEWVDFLGFKVASLLGVPAGPLLNSRWVSFAAKVGFDIVTYKTIRSLAHPAHPLPNMVYVETPGFLKAEQEGEVLHVARTPSKDMNALALTNSFGIPSRDPEYLIEDIERANRCLSEGQVMIVSVVGTPRGAMSFEDFVQDFVEAAKLARLGGAKIIEADFSCPNVTSCEGSVHTNPQAVFTISSRIKKEIGDIPLIIKVGALPSEKVLKEVMISAAKSGVQAICGINTLSMKVVKEDGRPALGENRVRAGVCGGPIRLAALDFIKQAAKVNQEEKLELTIMGTGGVTEYPHFDLFFEQGADVALSAIGMMWDPYLAMRYHAQGKRPWIQK